MPRQILRGGFQTSSFTYSLRYFYLLQARGQYNAGKRIVNNDCGRSLRPSGGSTGKFVFRRLEAITRFGVKINAEYLLFPSARPMPGKAKIPLTGQTAFSILTSQKKGGFYPFHRFRNR